MGKRKALALAATAGLCGLVAGGLIGFVWHAPGRAGTWADARTWLTFAAVVVGVPAALYQLNLQRRQFAGQQKVMEEEAARNRDRDLLLHGQIGELRQHYLAVEREQAEQVGFAWEDTETGLLGVVVNNSERPIRDVVCILFPSGQERPVLASSTGPMKRWDMPPPAGQWLLPADQVTSGHRVPLIRPGWRYGFVFDVSGGDREGTQMWAGFTDDAGRHWQVDQDLHLELTG